jgi:hypothetical protein
LRLQRRIHRREVIHLAIVQLGIHIGGNERGARAAARQQNCSKERDVGELIHAGPN